MQTKLCIQSTALSGLMAEAARNEAPMLSSCDNADENVQTD